MQLGIMNDSFIKKSRPGKVIKVVRARYLKDYVLRIFFDNGEERVVDFKPFLTKSRHPAIIKYRKDSVFRKFKVQGGNINWNDYDLIFPVSDLYNGIIN
jgi:hypothetical protein